MHFPPSLKRVLHIKPARANRIQVPPMLARRSPSPMAVLPPRVAAPAAAPSPLLAVTSAPTRAQVPTWFELMPTKVAVPESGAILKSMAEGRPFPQEVGERFATILGRPISAGGFETLFTPILPSALWVVHSATLEGSEGASFLLSAIDREGRVVFTNGCAMRKSGDGSVEVHNFGASVHPHYRSTGITAHGELLQEAILRSLSTHPNTRLTLSARSAIDPNSGLPQKGNGSFVHAARGYVFADAFKARTFFDDYEKSPLAQEGDTDRRLMVRHFAKWAEENPALLHRGQPAGAEARAVLIARIERCRTPRDFLAFDEEGFAQARRDANGLVSHQPVGQAFMLSGATHEWCGARFVNMAPANYDSVANELRNESNAIFQVEVTRELEHAKQSVEGFRWNTWEALCHSDPNRRIEGYFTVALHGRPELERFLRERLDGKRNALGRKYGEEANPNARVALQQALRTMRGDVRLEQMQHAVLDPSRTEEARQLMADRLRAIGGIVPAAPSAAAASGAAPAITAS